MVKLTGALFFLVDASFPWGIEVPQADEFAAIILPRAQHVVSYHIVLKGSGWVRLPDIPSTRFAAGDILVLAHGDPYWMLSAPNQTPEFDGQATLQFFRDMAAGKLPFVIPAERKEHSSSAATLAVTCSRSIRCSRRCPDSCK